MNGPQVGNQGLCRPGPAVPSDHRPHGTRREKSFCCLTATGILRVEFVANSCFGAGDYRFC